MVWQEFEPKKFEETDVDIEITHCGFCGSDIHTLRSGWAPTNYPVCVGQEIVGHAVRVGSAFKDIKAGDRVGVGAQSGSCQNQKGDCEACADGGAFVFKILDAIPSDAAAPMLCAGITVFSPMLGYNAGPGKKVGIAGIGGLGRLGILGAKALGCEEIVAISRSSSKKDDAMKMGATRFIATGEEEDSATKHAGTLHLNISTINSPNMPISEYFGLLRLRGQYVQVGAPEDENPWFSQ